MSTLIANLSSDQTPATPRAEGCISDPRIIRRVETVCELFEMAYEMKSLELRRQHPDARDEWIHAETLKLIEAGTR
jgi:hypothetical protein